MFKSLKTRFFTQYHLFVFIVIFALKNPRNPCGLWDFTDVIYFGRQSWLRYRGTVRFTFFRPLLRFPKKTLAPDSAGKNFIFPPLRRTPFASRKRGSLIPYHGQNKKHPFRVLFIDYISLNHYIKHRDTLHFAFFRPLIRFPEKTAHSRLHSRFLRCKNRCFDEPVLLRKNGLR